MPFDGDTGQVFAETIVPITQRRNRRESLMTVTLGQKPSYMPPETGAHSLRHIVIRHLLCNLHDLTVEALQALPTPMLDTLWHHISSAQLDSPAVWQLFARVGHLNNTHVKRIYVGNRHTDSLDNITPIQSLVASVADVQCNWLIDLTIGTTKLVEHTPYALIPLANIINLRNIHISTASENERFLDRVLREWSFKAREQGAFIKLKMIFVNAIVPVTTRSLQHLKNFPLLDTFVVRYAKALKPTAGKSTDRAAFIRCSEQYGWSQRSDSPFLRYAQGSCFRSPGANSKSLTPTNVRWHDLVEGYITQRRRRDSEETDIPVIDAVFGLQGAASFRPCTVDDIICLERDWSFQDPQHESQLIQKPTAKKRRLKDGKTQALANLLDSF